MLHAFDSVPRHLFVPEAVQHRAYEDVALPLGHGQTISRPGVHALHLQLARLTGSEQVLEIGTGSGFQTALLARLVQQVFSIEVVPELATLVRDRLQALEIDNVELQMVTEAWDGKSALRSTRSSSGRQPRPSPSLSETNWRTEDGC